MRARIYVDTSVIGGCLDDEFRDYSWALLRQFAAGQATMLLSVLTLEELAQAPRGVRDVLDEVEEEHIETLPLTDATVELADAYLDAAVVGPSMRSDAEHIAIATIARADVLVSWNFKHIVNLRRIHGFNSVNMRLGYPTLEIRSPREVLGDE